MGSRYYATEWDIEGWRQLHEFAGHAGGAVNAIEYTPDGSQILTGSRDGSIRRWDAESGKLLLRWVPHFATVFEIAVSPDGERVLSYGAEAGRGLVAESHIETGESSLPYERHTGSVYDVVMPDAETAVSGSSDGTLRVWNTRTGECIRTITAASLGVSYLAVSPESDDLVAVGCRDLAEKTFPTLMKGGADKTGLIRIIDIDDGDVEAEYATYRGWVRSLAYGPEGRLFSTADDGTLQIHEPYKPTTLLEEHLGEMQHGACVRTLSLTPDETMLYAAGRDGRITCWDTETGDRIAELTGHDDAVLSAVVTPDGANLVTASADNTLLVWEPPATPRLNNANTAQPAAGVGRFGAWWSHVDIGDMEGGTPEIVPGNAAGKMDRGAETV